MKPAADSGLTKGWLRRLAAYKNLSYGQIAAAIKDLQEKYPDFVKVKIAQEAFDLPSPGTCSDEKGQPTPCLQYVVTLTDHASLPDPERAEVFLSGTVHGNERVGPPTVLATITLLAKAADCVRRKCNDSGLPWSTLEWLAGLVKSRVLVAMPMTNALGYDHNTREEGMADPNRDFPFMQEPTECMTTITARALNEVWREHLFQLALTFHAGMESITYEWGSPNHNGQKGESAVSPDDTAQMQIATVLSQYAGHFGQTPKYQYGITNKVVYPVAGGMEDWAYAGSWDNLLSPADPPPVRPCKPTTFGGYPEEKTIYDNVTLRAFNILVETSDMKSPLEPALGTDDDLWEASGQGTGHVTRNVRLALALIDFAQPYVSWSDRSAAGCLSSSSCEMSVVEASPESGVKLSWRVGGALTVDETQLLWGPWPGMNSSRALADTCSLCSGEVLMGQSTGAKGAGQVQKGFSRWKKDGGEKGTRGLQSQSRIPGLSDPVFTATLNDAEALQLLKSGQDIFVVARARVDQDWKDNAPHNPDVPPQSHVVNARTNPNWFASKKDHVVRGRLDWYSTPLRLSAAKRSAAGPLEPSSASPDQGGLANQGTIRVPEDRSDQPVNMRVIARGFGFTVGMVAGLAVMLAVVMKLRSIVRTSRTGTRRSTYTPVTTVEAQDAAEVELGARTSL